MKKLRFILLALVPALVLMVSACANDEGSSSGGNVGRPVDPRCELTDNTIGYDNNSGVWEIFNENGLIALRNNVSQDAILVCDIELTNKAEGTSWIPIGSTSNNYGGTFDGNNYTISGLYINDSTAADQGLFGYTTNNATIKNLKVRDVEITALNYIAAIVSNNKGNIINVHVDNVTINSQNANSAIVGAISSENAGDIYTSSASNIVINGVGDADSFGGIVGLNVGNIVATYVDNITTFTNGNHVGLGGIVGVHSTGKIVSSYANDITFENNGNNTRVGGIVGPYYDGTLSSNFFVSDTLNGIGDPASNDNATRLTSVQALNDNISVMNVAINDFVTNIIGFENEFGFRFAEGLNTANDIPQLVPYVVPVERLNLSYPTAMPVDYTIAPALSYEPINTTQRGVVYSIDNDAYADINIHTGIITAKSAGIVNVTVKSLDNNAIIARFSVTIEEDASQIDVCSLNDMSGYYINTTGAWEIYNKYGLANLSTKVANSNDIINAKLLCDIELTNKADGTSWIPIGNFPYSYKGTFDGDNKTISDLYINDNSSDYQGLFGYSDNNSVIKNLKVKDVEITANNNVGAIIGNNYGNIYASSASNIVINSTSNLKIGGIAGINSGGDIVATYVDNATITSDIGEATLGGIVGTHYEGNIVSSYTNDVTFENSGNSTRVGGIVGRFFDGALSSNFFISDDGNLFGEGFSSNNDNATRVTSIQSLNDNVSVMNTSIDEWVDANSEIGFRYKAGTDTANDIPTLFELVAPLENLTLSYPATIYDNETASPTLTYEPFNTNERGVTYTIDNDAFASINAKTGEVTAKSAGTVTVTVTSNSNDLISTDFSVDIQKAPEQRCFLNDMTGYTDNTVTGIWEIYNVNGLIALRTNLTQDAKLVCNINLNNEPWTPIGTFGGLSTAYSGTFDGDNYTISGLYISNSSGLYQSLFGHLDSNGIVKNLKVTDVEITARGNAGAVIGRNNGDIINVHVSNVTTSADDHVGAIVGYNEGNIYASSANGINIVVTKINAFIGGITSANIGKIVATYVDNGRITLNGDQTAAGGIVGNNYSGTIVSSYANDVTFENSGNSTRVGGIVGRSNGTLSSNFFISDDGNLFGEGYSSHNDNATRVTSVQALNDNVSVMNTGIDEWVGANGEIWFRYEVLQAPDNASVLPKIEAYP